MKNIYCFLSSKCNFASFRLLDDDGIFHDNTKKIPIPSENEESFCLGKMFEI